MRVTDQSVAAAKAEKRSDRALDFGELDTFVGFQLHRARNAAATALRRLIAPEAMPGQFPILYLIARNPGQTQSAIAGAVGLDRSSLVPILNRLEKRGWVRRVPSRDDGRAHALELTEAGQRQLKVLYDLITSLEARISAELGGEAEQKTMLELLHRFRRALEVDRPD